MVTRSAGPEGPSTAKQLALVCAWALLGIALTGAAIWFGLEQRPMS
jgi:hypothetical protein